MVKVLDIIKWKQKYGNMIKNNSNISKTCQWNYYWSKSTEIFTVENTKVFKAKSTNSFGQGWWKELSSSWNVKILPELSPSTATRLGQTLLSWVSGIDSKSGQRPLLLWSVHYEALDEQNKCDICFLLCSCYRNVGI